MRVLLLTGPIEGGIHRHVEALLCGLPSEGVEPSLAGPARPGDSAVPWFALPLTDRTASVLAPATTQALRGVWRMGRWDLLHAHGYKAAVLAAVASMREPRLRYVVTLHNLCPPMGLAARLLTRLAIRRACRQIAVSGAILESIRAAGIATPRSAVIPNGVEWDRLATLPDRCEARAALRLGEGPVALFLGRLTREKGVFVLAEAASLAMRQREDWRCLIAGEGPEQEALARIASATPGIRLLGHRGDVRVLLAACDMVVVPSVREGQSLVALEAMAAGRPLVAAAVGGLAELARASSAPWTVPPDDPEALAATMERVLADPAERAARVARGQSYARAHGGWDTMVRRVAAVYREVLETC